MPVSLAIYKSSSGSVSADAQHTPNDDQRPAPNSVTGVEQDRAGFIWIATFDGLARYDGKDVKVYRHRPGDTLSLADNKIRDLQPAADGTFVVNTEGCSLDQ